MLKSDSLFWRFLFVLATAFTALIITLFWSNGHTKTISAIQAGANVAHGVLLPDVAGTVGKGVTHG